MHSQTEREIQFVVDSRLGSRAPVAWFDASLMAVVSGFFSLALYLRESF